MSQIKSKFDGINRRRCFFRFIASKMSEEFKDKHPTLNMIDAKI